MNPQHVIVAVAALFVGGMIWLRTRMQYSRPGSGPLRLQPAGRLYFAAATALLGLGWVLAPGIGHAFWPEAAATPTLMRVIWCLATYYIFILVHRLLKARGRPVYRSDGQGISP